MSLASCIPTLKRDFLEIPTLYNLLRRLLGIDNSNSTSLTLGGTINGMNSGSRIVLTVNSSDQTFDANGSFRFSNAFRSGDSYTVSIKTQPSLQTCTLRNGTGTFSTQSISTITIDCSSNGPASAVGVNVSGLSGTLSLSLGSGASSTSENTQTLSVSANGLANFQNPVVATALVAITITTQPSGQNCVITTSPFSTTMPSSTLTFTIACVNGILRYGKLWDVDPDLTQLDDDLPFLTTIAGTGAAGSSDNANGLSATLDRPNSIVKIGTDLYVNERSNNIIRKVSTIPPYATTFYAGGINLLASLDGNLTTARFNGINSMVTDGVNIYLADLAASNIRRIDTISGNVTTIAGPKDCNTSCPTGYVDAVGNAARFLNPTGLILLNNSLYVIEGAGSNRIRRIDLATLNVITFAGSSAGTSGFADGTGTSALFNFPGLARRGATDGTYLYVADVRNGAIRRIDPGTGNVITIAGSPTNTSFVDGPGATAHLTGVYSLEFSGTDLYAIGYLSTPDRTYVRKIKTSAPFTVSTVYLAQNGSQDGSPYRDVALSGSMTASSTSAREIEITTDGFYIPDITNNTVRIWSSGLVGRYAVGSTGNDFSSSRANGGFYPTTPSFFANQNGTSAMAPSFDGTNFFRATGNTKLPSGNAPRSLCAWVNPQGVPTGNNAILGYGTIAGDNYSGIRFSVSGTQLTPTIYNGSTSASSGAFNFHSNWMHVCGTFTGTNINLYVNGSNTVFNQGLTINTPVNATLYIGSPEGSNQFFTGRITDARVYSRVLLQEEIIKLATQVPDGLAAYYPIVKQENAGGAPAPVDFASRDRTLFKADLTFQGTLVGGNDRGDRFRIPNTSHLLFPGNGNFHTVNLSTSPNSGQWPSAAMPRTYCLWASPDIVGVSNAMTLFQHGTDPGTNSQSVDLSIQGTTGTSPTGINNAFRFSGFGAPFQMTANAITPFRGSNAEIWTHICGTYDGSTAQVFSNGTLINSAALSWSTGLTRFVTGRGFSGADQYSGLIDEIRIYNRVLSLAEIRALSGPHPYQTVGWPGNTKAQYIAANYTTTPSLLWTDSSGTGNHLDAGGANPGWNPFGMNGNPAVTFNGTTQYVRKSTNQTGIVGDNFTFFEVVNDTSQNGNMHACIGVAGPNGLNISYSSLNTFDFGRSTVGSLPTPLTPNANGNKILTGMNDSGGTVTGFEFGIQGATNTSANFTGYNFTGPIVLGANCGSADPFTGSISEFLYFNGALNSTDRRLVECYLSSRYNVPLKVGCQE